MKKKIIILFIIVLLLVVGLSGCTDSNSESSNYLSVFEVCEHPNKYLYQEITIKGYYFEDSWGTLSFKAVVEDTSQHVYGYAIELTCYDILEQHTLVKGGIYLFEGTLNQNLRDVLKEHMPLRLAVHNITAV